MKLFEMEDTPQATSKSNEWYTPAKYIEAARKVMGGIDLDPASCELANRTVQSARYYVQDENGLMQNWYGRIWCNPPYGRIDPTMRGSTKSYQALFTQKLLREYESQCVEQAILLIIGPSCFMRWFQPLWEYPMCFHDGRILFDMPDGSQSDFGFGNIFVYLGPNENRFTNTFSQFGRIVRAIDVPKPRPIALDLWAEQEAV